MTQKYQRSAPVLAALRYVDDDKYGARFMPNSLESMAKADEAILNWAQLELFLAKPLCQVGDAKRPQMRFSVPRRYAYH